MIINSLYGVPLYKPSVGPMYMTHGCGTMAAKAITEATGAEKSTKLHLHEQRYHPTNDPGLMRYICKVPQCTTFGGTWVFFNTEEENVAHWNMLHVAMLPQFNCQHPGCSGVVQADLGSLDWNIHHL